MSGLQEHIVSIWNGECNSGVIKGSGFCIAPKLLMTAAHVIENIKLENIHIGLLASTDSGGRVKKIHPMKDYDAVVLELYLPHKKPLISCQTQAYQINNGLNVELIAYHIDEKVAKGPIKTEISNHHKDNQHWLFSNYPAKGMSGGAVLHNGQVIGVIKAQDKENNTGLMIPLNLFADQLNKLLSEHLNNAKSSDLPKDQNSSQSIRDCHYKKEQRKLLIKHLKQLKEEEKTKKLYQVLIKKYLNTTNKNVDDLLIAMLEKVNENSATFVRGLRTTCDDFMQPLSNDVELLLLLCLSQINEDNKYEHYGVHELLVRTRLLVEIKMSSRFDLPIDLHKHEKLGLMGRFALSDQLAMREKGIDDETTAQQLAQTIAYRIYKKFDDVKDLEEDELDEYDWQALNDRLISLREKDFSQLHRFEVNIKRKASGNCLHSSDVCNELLKLLPDLPIVHFGTGMLDNESSLNMEVGLFYDKLKNKNQRETTP